MANPIYFLLEVQLHEVRDFFFFFSVSRYLGQILVLRVQHMQIFAVDQMYCSYESLFVSGHLNESSKFLLPEITNYLTSVHPTGPSIGLDPHTKCNWLMSIQGVSGLGLHTPHSASQPVLTFHDGLSGAWVDQILYRIHVSGVKRWCPERAERSI